MNREQRDDVIAKKPAQSLKLLLAAAAGGRIDLKLEEFHESQIQWAIDSGLGPLFRRCVGNVSTEKTSRLWSLLVGADLTGRVVAAEQMDAMEAIVRRCARQIQPVTLLKGISLRGHVYPEPHTRPMKDIDFLVEEAEVPVVESILLEMGYRRRSTNPVAYYETHHHTTPFFHDQNQIWVEVHRGLFPARDPVGANRVFSAGSVAAERRPSEFRGYPVYRLSDELQILYLASHWASDFSRVGGMVGMLDMIYLLKHSKAIHWNRILEWLDGGVAAAALYLLLTYLDRNRLVELPEGVLREISRRQQSYGSASLRGIHAVIDRYVVDGHAFGMLVSQRNFEIIWDTLLRPCPPSRRLPRLVWMLLPGRLRRVLVCGH